MRMCVRKEFMRAAALLAALLVLFGARTARADASVADADELGAALAAAALTPSVPSVLTFSGSITTTGSVSVPSYVTIDLNGNTWTVSRSTLTLSGSISGGTLSLQGTAAAPAALIPGSGAQYPAPVLNAYGAVRRAASLQLENASAGTETVLGLAYADGGTDATAYVQKSVTGGAVSVYAVADGGGTKAVVSVETTEGVYRLGTANTGTLSRTYAITYNLDGGALPSGSAANPGEYTASDGSVTLTNPEKQGFVFAGWSGTGLDPDPANNMRVTLTFAGMSGGISLTANWQQQSPGGGGAGRGGMGGTSAGDAAESTESDADVETSADAGQTGGQTAQSTVRIPRGSSSTKVTFTGETSAVMPVAEPAAAKRPFPWIALAAGAAALGGGIGLAAGIRSAKRRRERPDA